MTERAYMPPSKSIEYTTPGDLFDSLDEEFGPFTLDPCGRWFHHSATICDRRKGGHFYDGSSEAMNGLLQPWDGRVFMNPPYGRKGHIDKWIEKAVEEVYVEERVKIVVALLPARVDTRWWQSYILRGATLDESIGKQLLGIGAKKRYPTLVTATGVRFLPGRLKFGNKEGKNDPAPFPSAVVVWRKDD